MVIRVLVADDQAVVRTAFSGLLNTQDDIEVVGEAEDGEQAVAGAAELRPDVALLDIRMPRLGGIDAAREIVAASNGATRALMLTTFGLDEYVYDALTAGASGFLLKDATFPELLHAVRVVAGGHALLAPEITGRLIAEFARQRVSAPPKRSIEGLTAREAEVLVLIARGLSNADIADRLTITDHTVKTHINRLFAKMGLRDRAQAVILAYELGLVVAGNSGP
ncbi:response regulator transcription factor [Streptomyces filamentosus]|uniref:Response regulator transcription factor n=2 Tax=Streptomyces filamentosus TaxID=67294 RepID=A0ABY4USD9_STRFL|nr:MULTISPECIES: response regulator transcription factor [Streptomyces]MYR81858.1 response regulator [Streptomyces sp. SID5466]EFE77957.1 two-component system response regulator [Streptomyces filamentosus NRRL 15998]ESU49366.1 putative two-component system response regulator [Streptomyces sp. HCCB10043]EWS94878.1 two-component system response regulator [Streptomyces filamentosus NRRL 11379]USC46682.1 response regulator transcription factor [Streptomyces filamentosus]